LASGSAKAGTIYGLSIDNNIFTFDTASPGALLSGKFITPLGIGSVTATPDRKSKWGYSFGYRPQRGSAVDATIRQDRELQQRLKISPDQINRLDTVAGRVPCPGEAVAASFLMYVAASLGTDRGTARQALSITSARPEKCRARSPKCGWKHALRS
jgi:hypothetical protein